MIEDEATMNLNALKVVGANHALFEINSKINLRHKLGIIVCALFDLRRGLAQATDSKAQLDPWELRHLARLI